MYTRRVGRYRRTRQVCGRQGKQHLREGGVHDQRPTRDHRVGTGLDDGGDQEEEEEAGGEVRKALPAEVLDLPGAELLHKTWGGLGRA